VLRLPSHGLILETPLLDLARLDGNKRTALGACIVFLRLNGRDTAADGIAWETLTLDIADGSLDRPEATTRLRRLVGRRARRSVRTPRS
jgi:hypothetical protein